MTRALWRLRAVAAVGVVAIVAAGALGGCTGVPSSSGPQTIKPVDVGAGAATEPVAPPPGASARDIVLSFLANNAVATANHAAARAFLTPAARNRWTDTSVTVIEGESTSNSDPKTNTVVVHGRTIGSVNSSGVYTPSLRGTGLGGESAPFEYGMKKVNGEFRIDKLPKGVLITEQQFEQSYKQRNLYFFDLADKYLVPDERWSPLDRTQLEGWLLLQLAAGPRPELQNAVTADTLPAQVNTRHLAVTAGTPVRVEIPGSGQLDRAARDRLAAQVGRTFTDAVTEEVLTITDNGIPVQIPAAGSTQFTAAGFADQIGPRAPRPDVYYLRNGKIVKGDDGTTLGGAVNNGTYFLDSVALARRGHDSLTVAAVATVGSDQRLVAGTQTSGLRQTSVHGATLTRPAFVPGLSEVWVGSGRALYRVAIGAKADTPGLITLPPSVGGGRILSVRLSPEGSRVAIVYATANGAQQLLIGAVVRSAGQVRIDTVLVVSPQGVVINDAAWIGPTKLFAIGSIASSRIAQLFETNVDGSAWNGRGTGSLPDAPDSVTGATGQLAWVSATGTVWVQRSADWDSPGAASSTAGTKPVYLE